MSFPGDKTPIIQGCALKAMEGDQGPLGVPGDPEAAGGGRYLHSDAARGPSTSRF